VGGDRGLLADVRPDYEVLVPGIPVTVLTVGGKPVPGFRNATTTAWGGYPFPGVPAPGISRLPAADHVLAERCVTHEGHHLFLYPFEGRRVHEGLAALLALRLGRRVPATFSMAVNDHGLELLTHEAYPFAELLDAAVFSREGLVDDIIASVNISELMRRRFREIARVAGLVLTGPAHARHPASGSACHH